jgi:hypothetical protein
MTISSSAMVVTHATDAIDAIDAIDEWKHELYYIGVSVRV